MSVKAKISGVLLKYPNLGDGSYKGFLTAAARITQNHAALLSMTKADFDVEYAAKVRQKFSHDEKLAGRYIDESCREESQHLWRHILSKITPRYPGRQPLESGRKVESLALAVVGSHHRDSRRSKDRWARQTYRDFASKTEKKNPSVKFDKALMDDAFRVAVGKTANQTTSSHGGLAAFERMMARCLGDESKEYWKGRE